MEKHTNIERHYLALIGLIAVFGIFACVFMIDGADKDTASIIKDIADRFESICIFAVGALSGVAVPYLRGRIPPPQVEVKNVEQLNTESVTPKEKEDVSSFD